MKLLALATYCEGPKAQEIKSVITQLPAAYYRERTAADDEIGRLRKDNSNLKQRIALEALALRQPARPPSPPRSSRSDRETPRSGLELSSSMHSQYINKYTPPLPRALFPETSRPPLKRPRRETPPPPPERARPPPKRAQPVCTGCFQNGIHCNGRSECSACRERSYGCEYNECWEGPYCVDMKCTRLHPEQWNGDEEPRRIVKTKGRYS